MNRRQFLFGLTATSVTSAAIAKSNHKPETLTVSGRTLGIVTDSKEQVMIAGFQELKGYPGQYYAIWTKQPSVGSW